MIKVGDMLYDMRVVNTYHGQSFEPTPIFNGFEGIVVWITWDASDWMVLRTWFKNDKYLTKEIGIIDDNQILPDWNGEDVANFIKQETQKILEQSYTPIHQVTSNEVREQLLNTGIVATRNVKAQQHIPKKIFNNLVDMLTDYINKQITSVIYPAHKNIFPIAIDETIAQIIQIHEER